MAVRIIFGRTGSGKTWRCFEEIKSLLAEHRHGPLLMLVPEQFSYQAEKNLSSILGAIGSQTAEVLTFSRLSHRIFSVHSGAAKKVLTPAGKNMLVYRALYLKRNQLTVFSGSADKPGFVDQTAGTLSELKRYGIMPSDLKMQAQSCQNVLLSQKLHDLAKVYECYENLLSAEYVDADDNLYRAAALLSKSDYLNGACIWVDEFFDFLPQHYAMLEVLAKKAQCLTVTLCCDEQVSEDGLFAPAAKTYSKLQRMCALARVPIEKPVYLEGNLAYQSRELAFLERAFDDYSAPAYTKKTHDISLFEAEDVFGEAQMCARQILSLCRDEGYRFRQIAVTCGNISVYGELVKTVFEQHGIPCFLSEKPSLSTHPLVLMLLSALDVIVKNWDYESVFAFLKSGFSCLEAEEVDLLENYVLATGIKGKAWIQDEKWDYRPALFGETDDVWCDDTLMRLDELRRRAAAPLIKLRGGIGSKRTVKESCAAIYEFMRELNLFEKISGLVEQFKSEGQLVLANLYSRAWNAVMAILDQLVLIAGEEKMGMQALRDILAAGFSKQQSGIIPQSVDQVIITDVLNSRTCDCRILFVLGANSGYFPGNAVPEGILSDGDRTLLLQQGLELAPTTRQRAFDERFLIYKALTKPTCRLYISYSLSDAEGAALMPSPVVDMIRRMFLKITIISESDLCETQMITSPAHTFDALALRLRRIYKDKDRCSLWKDVLLWYQNSADYQDKCESLKSALSYTNTAKPISGKLISKAYSNTLYASVSRLEKYCQCPFSYFVSFALKAKERKILEIGPPDIGILIHRAIEIFTKRVMDEGYNWRELDSDWCRAVIGEIVDTMAQELFSKAMFGIKPVTALLGRLKRNLARCVLLLVEHISRGKFEPLGSEVRFGDGERLPAVTVDLGAAGKIKIVGVIDRLDVYETPEGTYFRVIDYKSGSKNFRLGNILNLLDLQLVVYLEAASLAKAGAKPAGMLYFRINEPLVRTDSRPDKQKLEKEINKQMKLDGVLLADDAVIKAMDSAAGSDSDILPVRWLKDGGFAKSSSVATLEQFALLSGYVKKSIEKIGREILDGKIEIRPYLEKGRTPCKYCRFGSICKFDPAAGRYNELPSFTDKQAWQELLARKEGETYVG